MDCEYNMFMGDDWDENEELERGSPLFVITDWRTKGVQAHVCLWSD